MITEDYVSFEIAKLLKEKGFDWECEYFYDYYEENDEYVVCSTGGSCNREDYPSEYSMPTLQMAMKWLVREHKLYVNVVPSVEGYYWTERWHSYVEELNKRYPYGRFIGTFNSHEQAAEEAIKYCLEHLI